MTFKKRSFLVTTKKVGPKNLLRFRLNSVNFQVFWAEICTVYIYTNSTKMNNKKRHPTHTTDAQKSKKKSTRKIFYQKTKMQWIFFSHILMEFDRFLIIALGCWTHKTHAFSCVNQLLYFICNYTSIACRYIVLHLLYSLKNSYIATKKAWIKCEWRIKNTENKTRKYQMRNRTETRISTFYWKIETKSPKIFFYFYQKWHTKNNLQCTTEGGKRKKKVKKQCSSPKFKQQEFTVFYFDMNVIIWKMEYRTITQKKYFY